MLHRINTWVVQLSFRYYMLLNATNFRVYTLSKLKNYEINKTSVTCILSHISMTETEALVLKMIV
jgi:hypothetical protein